MQVNFLKREFKFESGHGNVSYANANATHFGATTLWNFEKTSNYMIEISFVTESGNIIFKYTMKPCDEKSTRTMTRMLETVSKINKMDITSDLFPCPLEGVKT